MKYLKPSDARGLGYFVVCVCLGNLAVRAGDSVGGWMNLPLCAFGMLGVAILADATDGQFIKKNPWLMGILLVLLCGVPWILITVNIWNGKYGYYQLLAIPLTSLAIIAYAWYVRVHGKTRKPSTASEGDETVAAND